MDSPTAPGAHTAAGWMPAQRHAHSRRGIILVVLGNFLQPYKVQQIPLLPQRA
eukprot:COSAG01_NODE_4491_length_4978_cov_17.492109_3_plen_53_part_00